MSFLTSASKFPRWCYSFPLLYPLHLSVKKGAYELNTAVFYTIKTTPTPHINTHTAPGGRTNKAVPSPINLTFSSVPEPASKLSYLGERGEPRENARASAKPRGAEERSFPDPRFRVSSRASTFHAWSPKWRACSQAICSSSKSSEIWKGEKVKE